MGWGVLEPKNATGTHVPGTALFYDDKPESHAEAHVEATNLKHSKSGVVLNPQPSDSPNDPLNWPTWKKELLFFSLLLNGAVGGVLGPILATVEGVIAHEFMVSINDAALLAGYPLLTAGIMAWLASGLAPSLGKRPVYLFCAAIQFATTVWNIYVSSYGEFLACRTLQGIGNGAIESIIISTIGDVFFAHQRGKRVLIANFAQLGIAVISPIAGGRISELYGWRTQFKILAGFAGLMLLFTIFCLPETTYMRNKALEIDMTSGENVATAAPEKAVGTTVTATAASSDDGASDSNKNATAQTASSEPKKSFLAELSPFSGLHDRTNPIILLLRPFVVMTYPALLWAFTAGGMWSTWTVGLSIVVAQIFAGPPNLFSVTQLGFLFTFPFVFTLLGFILGAVLADWYPKFAARRNNGVFEPEFRLIMYIPVLCIGIPGLFAFGVYASGPGVMWQAASCLQGMIGFATILSASVAYTYILDCHRNRAVEIGVAYAMLRNFFWFGSSWFLPQWLVLDPTRTVFFSIGGLQLALALLAVPMYMFGKKARNAIHRRDPLVILRLVKE